MRAGIALQGSCRTSTKSDTLIVADGGYTASIVSGISAISVRSLWSGTGFSQYVLAFF